MSYQNLKDSWSVHFKDAENQLDKMSKVKGVISAFNSNIDAVIKISGAEIAKIIEQYGINASALLTAGDAQITTNSDAIRGFVKCFVGGIAEEWLIENVEVFNWLNKVVGYDKLQMGGQGGIVANAMAVCGVNPVYVHTASSPEAQAKLFLDLPNLKNVDEHGEVVSANSIARSEDIPLIHWIIEFDRGDTITLNGDTYTCPKSNRFIATYDPLNFKLHIDDSFDKAMCKKEHAVDYIILSGYQILQETLACGTLGCHRVEHSMEVVNRWRANSPNHIIHFEIASTQDKVIRKYLIDKLANQVDSIGFNERELIDILEVIGEEELAQICDKETTSSNLFKGMLKLFNYVDCPRMQLHMFGLYLTIQKKGFRISPLQNRRGMQLAANIAATKAGTGAINSKENLLWSKALQVSDIGLKELSNLSDTVRTLYGENSLLENGIFENSVLEIIAVPTIIIDKPVTLVGMGDTISSISLVGAQ